MTKSPWSKVPVLSPQDQIEYDKMRARAALQERINVMGEGYKSYQKKPRVRVKRVDSPDEIADFLVDILGKHT